MVFLTFLEVLEGLERSGRLVGNNFLQLSSKFDLRVVYLALLKGLIGVLGPFKRVSKGVKGVIGIPCFSLNFPDNSTDV